MNDTAVELKDAVLAELSGGTHTEAFADGARFALQEALAALATERDRLTRQASEAIRAIEIGPGSEHWTHGRGTMQVDAVKALEEATQA